MWPNTKPKKCIIWGANGTHQYIHYGYYQAMKFLKWDVEWINYLFDDTSKYNNCDEYLFILEGNNLQNIPINPNAFYILHNCDMTKFTSIPEKNKLIQQVFTKDVYTRNVKEIHNGVFQYWQEDANTFYMPWATDLTPDEIDENIQKVKDDKLPIQNTNRAFFLGTVWDGYFGNINELNKFREGCNNINLPFEINNSTNVHAKESIELIQNSTIAPTICGTWQKNKGYIPCRIFKTISYGHIGCTNSKESYECLNKLIIYDEDESKVAEMALQKINDKDYRITAMEYVRNNHTYVNRIETIQNIFKYIK
jgi:hypothetical protein